MTVMTSMLAMTDVPDRTRIDMTRRGVDLSEIRISISSVAFRKFGSAFNLSISI